MDQLNESQKGIYLLDLKLDNDEFDKFVFDYNKREKIATTFIPTIEFARNEIVDFKNKINNPFYIDVFVSDTDTVRPFSHAYCATLTFESLTFGRNLTVGQIIEQAKVECEKSNRKILSQYGRQVVGVLIDQTFESVCFTWIKTGIAFTLYIKFLYEKMRDHELSFEKFKNVTIINTGNSVIINTGNAVNIQSTINELNKGNDQK